MDKIIRIAIDGPSGAGKSTLAKRISHELDIAYVDTGAMYRAVGLNALRANIALDDIEGIKKSLKGLEIDVKYIDGAQHIFIDGEDVSSLLHTEDVSQYASTLAALGEVRAFLLDLQRSVAAKNSVIMDGRDIGTVILPDAEVKIFLTADETDRAERRYKEHIALGEDVTFEEVLESVRLRDKRDIEREVSPLIAADDAIVVDTTGLTLDQAAEKIRQIIWEKKSNV